MRLDQQTNLTTHPVAPGRSVQLGYKPTWVWRAPPGIGDAPQFVWDTFTIPPSSVEGVGDCILRSIKINQQPSFIGMQYLQNGIPQIAGSYHSGPLTYAPIGNSPTNQMFPSLY